MDFEAVKDVTDDLFISADEAAATLGVSVGTLYTYVSRKQIRSQKVSGTRQRRYWRPDIERVAQGRSASKSLIHLGISHDSDITLVTPNGPYYRGKSAIELAETHSIEDIAGLLWKADSKSVFGPANAKAPAAVQSLFSILQGASSIDTAIALFPFLEQANPLAYDLSHFGMTRTGAEVMRWYAAILADRDAISDAPLHVQIADYVKGGDEVADLIRRLLVLAADHGFGAGAHAVRAVAGTAVSPYRSVLAGFAIVTGRRTSFGRMQGVRRLLSDIAEAHDPRAVIVARLQVGEKLPGFESPAPYEGGDPRANALLKSIDRVFGDKPICVKTMKMISLVEETLGVHPSFALVNALLAHIIGLPDTKILYILGRCAGWVAHSIEQYEAGSLVAPSANYKGSLPAPA